MTTVSSTTYQSKTKSVPSTTPVKKTHVQFKPVVPTPPLKKTPVKQTAKRTTPQKTSVNTPVKQTPEKSASDRTSTPVKVRIILFPTCNMGTNSTRFHVEITIINFFYYYYLTIGGLGFRVWGLGV